LRKIKTHREGEGVTGHTFEKNRNQEIKGEGVAGHTLEKFKKSR